MPNRKQFKSNEEYNNWFRKYRKNNIDKMRKYQREYNRKWRKNNGYAIEYKWAKNNTEKRKVHRLLQYAVKIGHIIKKPCEVCGEKAVAHHPDYSKPLEVKWLCKIHHRAEHERIRCA